MKVPTKMDVQGCACCACVTDSESAKKLERGHSSVNY